MQRQALSLVNYSFRGLFGEAEPPDEKFSDLQGRGLAWIFAAAFQTPAQLISRRNAPFVRLTSNSYGARFLPLDVAVHETLAEVDGKFSARS